MTSIYVASSWKNPFYKLITAFLESAGFKILDWRNPAPGNYGFAWQQIDENWQFWTPEVYRQNLNHPIAVKGYHSDFNMMLDADICVLLLPCGKSAHLEAGWFAGMGRPLYILLENIKTVEPELMYKLATKICLSIDELLNELEKYSGR